MGNVPDMRLDEDEKIALKESLKDFSGEVYLFGSRLNNKKNGGDIDILLVPKTDSNHIKLSLEIQRKFFSICEEDIDVIIYDESLFSKEILKNAQRIDIKRI